MRPESETKLKLLRTAIELIAESSYGSVSVDDICQRAGVKKGSFYHFFPSKSDLTVAAMEADWQAGQIRLDRIFSSQTPPLERLEAYFESSREIQALKQAQCGKICGCPMITLGAELSTQDEKIRLKTVEIVNRYLKYFESAVRDAAEEGTIETGNARLLAEELFAYFQGSMLQAKIHNDLKPLLALKKGLSRFLEPRPATV
ncbi:MAG TPA: TetR/AcrR family transcriptional regulator [Chthoniobacterales bacterium]